MYTESETMVRAMARQFAQERLWPTAAERDQTSEPPLAILREMGDLGLMGMTVPEQWGGSGMSFLAYILALEEIAAGDGAISTIMSVNNSLVGSGLIKFATDQQRERFLKPLALGEVMGAFGLTEPQAGSDAAAIATRAVEQPDGTFVINGTKQFITSGSIAGFTLIFAVTDPDQPRRSMSAFIVPTDTPGYSVGRIEHKLGQRCSDTAQLIFDDMVVGPELMLGERGNGYKIALGNLEAGRIGIAAQAVGMARSALDAAVAYADQRESFGTAIKNHQAVAWRLADMATQIEAARQLVHYAARRKDAGEPCLKEASMAKLFASEIAERVCSDAIQTFGGYGYVNDFPVERIYRDVRVCQIYEGTSDIQRLVISREVIAGR